MSLEKLEACPVCSQTAFRSFLTCKDYTASQKLFHVEQCLTCQLLVTSPRPTEETAGSYYQSKSYISHTSAAAGVMDYIYLVMRRFTLRWKFNMVKKYLNGGKLLDYGAGTGQFVNYVSAKGVATFGIEPSNEARAISKNENVFESLQSLTPHSFDVITLWHVLEHVYSIDDTIEKLKSLLTKNGTIFIAVPNWESYDAQKYQEQWAAYDVPRHIWHFSKDTMVQLMKNHALEVKEILPMKLDSFYVSLLSEKNSAEGKLSVTAAMRAMAIGLRSNLKAKSNNYSSLIYRVQQ